MNVKVLLIFIIILPFLMGTGCSKRKFSAVSNPSVSKVYNFDETGNFTKIKTVSANEIRDFLDDLPKDAVVKKVKVNQLRLSIDTKNGNTTSELSLTGLVGRFMGDPGRNLWFLNSEELSGAFGNLVTDLHINSVLRSELGAVKRNIENMILGNDFGSLDFIITGVPNSPTARTLMDVTFKIDIQIEFDYCAEVWDFLDAGEECDL